MLILKVKNVFRTYCQALLLNFLHYSKIVSLNDQQVLTFKNKKL